jgi:hypothetical protein
MTKKAKMKIAHSYRLFVCECGCGSVNLVLEDEKGEEIAAAQMHPRTILDKWVAVANQALSQGPSSSQWDEPSALVH